MRSIKMILLGLVLSGSVFFLSCKNDDDPTGCNYYTETQDELDRVVAAANAYGADPTNPVLCQEYKDAYQDYLDELEDHIECAALSGQQNELQNSIDQAQAELALLQC